jgi:hypothetical protein
MNSTTITVNDHHIDTADFLDVIRDLDEPVIDLWQLRALEWARFMDRQRAIGFKISIGGPS